MPDDEPGPGSSAANPFVHRGPDDSAGDLRILETVVDDVSPERLGSLHERLTDYGAHHVSVLAVTTKQSRPGHLVRVTVHPDDADAIARHLARATGTTGVKELRAAHRFVAETTTTVAEIDVDGETYEVPVKLALMDDEVYDISAEYQAAARIADRTDTPTDRIIQQAEQAVDAAAYSTDSTN